MNEHEFQTRLLSTLTKIGDALEKLVQHDSRITELCEPRHWPKDKNSIDIDDGVKDIIQ